MGLGLSKAANPRNGRSGRGALNNKDSNRGKDSSRGHQGRGGKPSRPQRNPFDNPSKLQQLIARGLENGEVVQRGKGQGPKRVPVHVRGWQQSKAASNPGGCITSLKDFIERKASKFAGRNIKITSSRTQGSSLIINALPDDAEHLLKLNTFSFAGAPLEVEQNNKSPEPEEKRRRSNSNSKPEESEGAKELKLKLKSMLDRRYNPETKLLDLSSLGVNDPEFAGTEMFETQSRKQKFVPALMKVCNEGFPNAQKKREAVVSISLASNALPDVSAITTIAQTFPEIINLDLSNNQIKNLAGLKAWSRRFKSLDHLILSGNPIETTQPDYHKQITNWFRTLRTLNNVQVRSEEEAAKHRKPLKLAPVIAPTVFHDVNQIGQNFITQFFPNFDTNRTHLVTSLYDSESTFTVTANTSGHHSDDDWKPASYGDWFKSSHNLLRITGLPARLKRCYKGTTDICNIWNSLPKTTHPDIMGEPQRWCIECVPVPGLPDPWGQSASGSAGLQITVHGQFAEPNPATGEIAAMRSFDRTFLLGAGGGMGGTRVISDTLTLRAYGGFDGFTPTNIANIANGQNVSLQHGHGHPVPVDTAPGASMEVNNPVYPPGDAEQQAKMQQLVLELSQITGLTLHYAQLCMEQANWDASVALPMFEQVKATLPAEAYVTNEEL
jgi:nuclear RNA export factor